MITTAVILEIRRRIVGIYRHCGGGAVARRAAQWLLT
jgi:hypothetical protein